MIKTLIDYLNGLIAALDIFDELEGLTEVITISEDIKAPAIYCANGDYNSPDFEINTLWHVASEEVEREDEISQFNEGQTDVTETHPVTIYAVFSKDVMGDDAYAAKKVAGNILNVISNATNKTIKQQLQLYSFYIKVSEYSTNNEEIWEEVFEGIDYELPSDKQLLKISYDFELKGPLECFQTFDCADPDTTIDVEQAIIDKYCDPCPDCPDCGTLFSIALLYKDGQTESYSDAMQAGQDAGFHEAGAGTDFFNLGYNNAFGNQKRFTDENGAYYNNPMDALTARDKDGNAIATAFDNDYMIDHRTGIGWYVAYFTRTGGDFWQDLLNDCANLNIVALGHSDFRMARRYELDSLQYMEPVAAPNPINYNWQPFSPGVRQYLDGHSALNGTSLTYYHQFSTGEIRQNLKTGSQTRYAYAVRDHYDKDGNAL